MGTRTDEDIEKLCSDLPPVVSSKDEIFLEEQPLPSVKAKPQGWHLMGDFLLFTPIRIVCWTLMLLLNQAGLGRHQCQPKAGVGLRRPRHHCPPP